MNQTIDRTSSASPEDSGAQAQASEDYPLSAVPSTARKPVWSLALLLMGFALTSSTLFAGGALGPAFKLWPDLLVIIVLGNAILGLYCAALSYIAYKTGLTTVLLARFSFGNVGSRWVDFILGFTQIGWYAFTTAIVVEILNELIGLPTSLNWLVIVLFTYAFCVTAYIGYAAIDWLSRLAVPAMLVLVGISLMLAFSDAGGGGIATQPTGELSFGAALALIVGTFISGGTQSTNWSRFANSGKSAVLSTLAAFSLVNGLLVFAGAFCTIVYGSEDLVQALANQGILAGGLILLILNVWTTQDNTIYAFSVAGANMFRTRRRHGFVIGGATVALLLSLSGIYNWLFDYLVFLGTVIPPVGGIIMADYWWKHRQSFPPLQPSLPAFNWAGVISYVAASAIAFFSGQADIGIGPVNGVVSAGLLYIVLSQVIPQPISSSPET